MRFLVDQNLSPRVAQGLEEAGHDALHVRDVGLARASDTEVLRLADEEGRVVVSADTDFASLLAQSGAARPSIVLIRRTGARTSTRLTALLLANLPHVASDLEAGAVVVFDAARVRVRPLPLLQSGRPTEGDE